MPVAETSRLILRRFTPDDLDAVAELLGHPEVMRFSVGVKTREESRRWLESTVAGYAANDWGHWAVVERGSGEVAGFCGLKSFEIDGRAEVEIGYRLLPAYWGRGLASEAAAAARDAGFERYGLSRLISLVEAENVGSWRVAENVGMRHEKDVEKWGKRLRVYAIEKAA